jgi:hypothetical protein
VVRRQILEVGDDPVRWLDLIDHLSQAGWEELNRRLLHNNRP